MASKRIETALSEEVYELVKEVASMWGMTLKSYIAKSITESALADNERFNRVFGETNGQSNVQLKEQHESSVQRDGGETV